MKLVVFGASGKVGRLVVREAIKRGYDVTAVVYEATEDIFGDGVRTIHADVHNRQEVNHALANQECVISTLGSWGTKTKDILTAGMNNIIPAMETLGIRRIISLTGADARAEGDRISFSSRVLEMLLRLFVPKVYEDGQKHLELLEKSELDWTVIRSPKMKNGEATHYRLDKQPSQAWNLVSRHTVAQAMLDEIENARHVGQAPILHVK